MSLNASEYKANSRNFDASQPAVYFSVATNLVPWYAATEPRHLTLQLPFLRKPTPFQPLPSSHAPRPSQTEQPPVLHRPLLLCDEAPRCRVSISPARLAQSVDGRSSIRHSHLSTRRMVCATSPSNLSHVRSLHQRILEMIKKTFSSKKQLFSNSLVTFYVDKQKITCNSRWAVRASTCRFSASCCPHPINTRTPLRLLNPCLLGSILPCRHTRLNS